MLNFTVGPVQLCEKVLEKGGEQIPYFRTTEFSEIMLENENLIKKFSKATKESRVAFMTCSGSAAMEAAIMNLFNENDKVIIINGGSFGQRFVELCNLHNIQNDQICLEIGKNIKDVQLEKFRNKGYTALLVNLHETSTGELYDIEMISEFCKENNIFLLVDAISAFLADSIDMDKLKIGAMIASSQKALACPPGVSFIVLSKGAISKIENNKCGCLYFNLKDILKNGERGQTPFTPAVSILLQINCRLKQIDAEGGEETCIKKTLELAKYFRDKIKVLPLECVPDNMSNALTAVHPLKNNAYEVFEILKDEYNIFICPNGGKLKNKIFRVGHIGDLKKEDYDQLINALHDLNKRNIL